MKKARALIALVIGGFMLACSGTAGRNDVKNCYSLDEGDTKTTLIVEDDGSGASITVYEWEAGVEVTSPEAAPGRMDGSDFIYPDGTRLTIDETSLTWPADSMLKGAVFQAESCP